MGLSMPTSAGVSSSTSMSISSSTTMFELLCVALLGLGQMFIMTGYDTQAGILFSFVVESVVHAVHMREPSRIDAFAGYYGQATCYAAYLTACLFAPSVLRKLSTKWTLFFGSLCFTIYQVGFLYLNKYYFYFSCAVMGVGFACNFSMEYIDLEIFSVYYTGHGSYLTSHSTRKSIERNSAVSWSIGCLCMIVGSGILAVIFSLNKYLVQPEAPSNETEIVNGHTYRYFSDSEIRMMYGAFAAITFFANITFAMIPWRGIPNCIESRISKTEKTFHTEMALIGDTFVDKRMITLSPLFIHLGLYTSFWISVYPTSLIFTKSLSRHIYLPASYSLAVGTGEVIMGAFISTMSKRVTNFGLKPTMFIAFGLTTILLLVIVLSVPPWATIELTNDPTFLIKPSVLLSTTVALLIGLTDSCVNNVRNVICALALPEARAQSFAISKFYQASAGAMLMFVSPYLSILHYAVLLFFTLSLATVCFIHVAGQTKKMERASSAGNSTFKLSFAEGSSK
ncbi:unnamed protein product [Angiostrongylus costaricensis]|uniref:UNC93-like protein 2 n=1 Tax=Angiostrongylus costaricensis TaxID=334426 RepID=A0A158PJF6_ANGCS|nr:unnamed protein product [Angiostrongylus costaricensis]